MKRHVSCIAAVVLAGCSAVGEHREQVSDQAIDAAKARANCSEAKGTVLGRTALPMPASYAGPERIQYTIGVEGCGKSMNVVVVCAAGTPCFVAGTDKK
jgi:hypothetical protein